MKMTTEQFLSHLGIEVGKPFQVDYRQNYIFRVDYNSNSKAYSVFMQNSSGEGFYELMNNDLCQFLGKEITPLSKYTLTEEDKNLLIVIPKDFTWASRDRDGLHFYTKEPKYDYDYEDYGCTDGITTDGGPFWDYLKCIKMNENVSLDELRKCL